MPGDRGHNEHIDGEGTDADELGNQLLGAAVVVPAATSLSRHGVACAQLDRLGEEPNTKSAKHAIEQVERVAPTGSSHLMRSKNMTPSTTKMPPMAPMSKPIPRVSDKHAGCRNGHQSRQAPFKRHAKVRLAENQPCGRCRGESQAAAAAVRSHDRCREIAPGSAAIVLPGLNPNQPSQRTKQPMVASDRLCPGIALTLAVGSIFSNTRAENHHAGQGRPTADGMHLRTAGKIEETQSFCSKPPPHIQCPRSGR